MVLEFYGVFFNNSGFRVPWFAFRSIFEAFGLAKGPLANPRLS